MNEKGFSYNTNTTIKSVSDQNSYSIVIENPLNMIRGLGKVNNRDMRLIINTQIQLINDWTGNLHEYEDVFEEVMRRLIKGD